MSENLIPIKRVADRLGVSRRTVERLMADRKLPSPLKQGRGSFLTESDVSDYIERLKERRDGK